MGESTPKKRTGNKPIKDKAYLHIKLTRAEIEALDRIAESRGSTWGGVPCRSDLIRAWIKDALDSMED